MKLFSRICTLIVVLLILGSVSALAEPYRNLNLEWEGLNQNPNLEREGLNRNLNLEREITPELGDSSIATTALVGLAGLTLTGAVVAHKKARSNAQ